MWVCTAGLLIVVAAYLIYNWFIRPIKVMNHYEKIFKLKGYKVAKLPYKPYSAPFFDEIVSDQNSKNDPMYRHKRQYTNVEVVITNMLTNPNIVLMNPEMIKEITSPEKAMVAQKQRKMYEIVFSVFNKGILTSERTVWKNKRRLLSKLFNYDFITEHIPLMIAIADQTFQHFEDSYWQRNPNDKQKREFKAELTDMMTKYTASIIISGFLGMESLQDKLHGQPITGAILRLLSMAMNSLDDPLALIFGKKLVNKGWRKSDRQFTQLQNDINSVLKSYITKLEEQILQQAKDKNATNKSKSIVKMLIEQRNKQQLQSSQSLQFEISNEQIIDQIKTFVIAGAETTTTFMVGMLFFVFEKPEVVARLRIQINSVIKSDQDIGVANFKKLRYLECVINQTSRMLSSAVNLFTRRLAQDTTIGGVPVSKGTLIDCTWISILYNPQVFEHPMDFIPQRWEKEQSGQYLHLIALTFSGGPRGCLGKNLALTEMKVMMIKFMQRYENLQEVGLKERSYEYGLTYAIKNTESVIRKQT